MLNKQTWGSLGWTRCSDFRLITQQEASPTYIKQTTFSGIQLTLTSFLLLIGTTLDKEHR